MYNVPFTKRIFNVDSLNATGIQTKIPKMNPYEMKNAGAIDKNSVSAILDHVDDIKEGKASINMRPGATKVEPGSYSEAVKKQEEMIANGGKISESSNIPFNKIFLYGGIGLGLLIVIYIIKK